MQYDEFTVFRRKSQKLIDIYKMMWEEWLEMMLKETYNSVMWILITKA